MPHPQRRARSGACAIATVLCLCVIMQMLGLPVTLLHAADISVTFAASELEGVTVPPALPQLVISSEFNPLAEPDRVPCMAAAVATPFHPPLR